MAKRDSFLLRVDPAVLEAIRQWADDEMRSMNAQIEFILRSKLKDTGRLTNKSNASEVPLDLTQKTHEESPK